MSGTHTIQTEHERAESNPIIEWASLRPHWEKYIWKHFLEQGSLSEDDIQEAYRLFKVENGLLPGEEFENIKLTTLTPLTTVQVTRQPLKGIKGIENVNALQDGSEIVFSPNLTVCYGANGSGKSGYGRIIASACFTRGVRKIHPNLKAEIISSDPAKAEFIIGSDSNQQTIPYTDGDQPNSTLLRFSMFDSHSAHIQLDDENVLQFTPAQLVVFDKVNNFVKSMETYLSEERAQKNKQNPLENAFGESQSMVSKTLVNPDLTKKDEEILAFVEYPHDGDKQIDELTEQRTQLIKMNIESEKKKLEDDKATLERFNEKLKVFKKNYDDEGRDHVNKLIKNVKEKRELVANLSTDSFNDGIFKSTGSEKWKSLLRAAQELFNYEKELNDEKLELDECLLCHQPLSDREQTLFDNYWNFLQSTAEADLNEAQKSLDAEKKRIELIRLTPPQTNDDEPVIKVLLGMRQTELVEQLRFHLDKAVTVLLDWDDKIETLTNVDNVDIPEFFISAVDTLSRKINDQAATLKDPQHDIDVIESKITELQHRKFASNVKEEYKHYLNWRRWQIKADNISMSATKRNYTDERSNLFDLVVTDNYIRVFQQECQALGAETDIEIKKRGSDGKTLVSKKLRFSRDKSPSEILSEGEQKVCAIADFLSEARLDLGNWGVIFDDPVTSLDHERKEKIAKRLVSLADDKQVILFTHDITFLLSLMQYAELKGVDCKRVTVRKIGTVTGVVDDKMPWVAENCRSRKGYLRNELQSITAMFKKHEHPNEIEKAVKSWCELLRESWERAVEERVLQGTVERFRPSVQTTKLTKLNHLNDPSILAEVEAGMTESSKWVHDRSAWLNTPMTDDVELNSYLDRYENFLKKCPIK